MHNRPIARLPAALAIASLFAIPDSGAAQQWQPVRPPVVVPAWPQANLPSPGMAGTNPWSAPTDWLTGPDLDQLFRGNTVVSRLVGRPTQGFFFARDGAVLARSRTGQLMRIGSWSSEHDAICTAMQTGSACYRFRLAGRQLQAWLVMGGWQVRQAGVVELLRGNQFLQGSQGSGAAAGAALAILGLGALLFLDGGGGAATGVIPGEGDAAEQQRRLDEEERRHEQERRRNAPRSNPWDGVGCQWGYQSTGTCVR
jgi:hypothetical protein